MSRTSDRQAVKAALVATDRFQTVIAGWPRRLSGQTPVAVIVGLASDPRQVARSAVVIEHTLAAWVLVRNDADDDPEVAEDTFDGLVAATLSVLQGLNYTIDRSSTEPYNTPLVAIDGFEYRAERIPFRRTQLGV